MAPRPGVRNQFWSFGTGTSFQKLAPVSKFNSGILNWGTRVQESTLAFKNRLWNHGPGQLFQEAFWLFLSQLWNFGEAPFLGPGTCCQLWDLGLFFLVQAICFEELALAALESGTLCWAGRFVSSGVTCF